MGHDLFLKLYMKFQQHMLVDFNFHFLFIFIIICDSPLKCCQLCDSKHTASMVNIYNRSNPVEYFLSDMTKCRINMLLRKKSTHGYSCLNLPHVLVSRKVPNEHYSNEQKEIHQIMFILPNIQICKQICLKIKQ